MKQHLRFTYLVFFILSLSVFHAVAQTVYNYAGNGTNGDSGNGGAATSAELSYPLGVAVDPSGNIIIADPGNNNIRKINTSGIISLVAGTGLGGYSGDGGASTSAQLNLPINVAIDAAGNIYIADADNDRIRKINTSGVITTVAGTGTMGFSGDGGAATSAKLNHPYWVAVDRTGNIYIADQDNNRIRKVDTSGIIHTIAGTGGISNPGTGNGGLATSAKFSQINAITVDNIGNIYVSDANQIRKIDTAGIITLVAGTGTYGYSGDNGAAISAKLNNIFGLAFDAMGNICIRQWQLVCAKN